MQGKKELHHTQRICWCTVCVRMCSLMAHGFAAVTQVQACPMNLRAYLGKITSLLCLVSLNKSLGSR